MPVDACPAGAPAMRGDEWLRFSTMAALVGLLFAGCHLNDHVHRGDESTSGGVTSPLGDVAAFPEDIVGGDQGAVFPPTGASCPGLACTRCGSSWLPRLGVKPPFVCDDGALVPINRRPRDRESEHGDTDNSAIEITTSQPTLCFELDSLEPANLYLDDQPLRLASEQSNCHAARWLYVTNAVPGVHKLRMSPSHFATSKVTVREIATQETYGISRTYNLQIENLYVSPYVIAAQGPVILSAQGAVRELGDLTAAPDAVGRSSGSDHATEDCGLALRYCFEVRDAYTCAVVSEVCGNRPRGASQRTRHATTSMEAETC